MVVSKALMYVFDPTQHAQMRKMCQGKTDDPQVSGTASSFRQDLVLSEATRRIRAETGMSQGQRDQRPLIVVLTKYDVWRAAVNAPVFSTDQILRRSRNEAAVFDVTLLKQVSDKFRTILQNTAPEIVSTAEAFSNDVTYIPVSSLGCSPQTIPGTAQDAAGRLSLGINPADIAPVWSEIPLLYAIHRTIPGFLPVS